LRIRLQDRPGALFHVARIFDEQQANIIEVYHQRVFTSLPAKGLITDIECETRDRAHLDQLMAALAAAGYEVSPVEQIGRAHVCTPVTNANLVCRLLLET